MWLGFRECQKRMALNNQGYPPGKGFFAHLEEVVTVKQCAQDIGTHLPSLTHKSLAVGGPEREHLDPWHPRTGMGVPGSDLTKCCPHSC